MCEICSKLTTKTPTKSMLMMSFLCLHCQVWTYFTHCSGISVEDFDQINVAWGLDNLSTTEPALLTNSIAVFAWWELETRCINRFDFIMPKLYHISLTDSNDNTSSTKHVEMGNNIGNLDSFKFQGCRVVINLQL